MAKRWSFEEDCVVCKFCSEKQYRDIEYELLGELVNRLVESGFERRSSPAVYKRAKDFTYLLRGWYAPYAVNQVKAVYKAFTDREQNHELYQSIKTYIRENYRPEEEFTSKSAVVSVIPNIFDEADNSYRTLHTVNYRSTFPMVLQKYVDLKGIKNYTTMCRGIGMKPDTFSSILRGKYKHVQRDNVLKICIGLKLHLDEAEELLKSASLSFSDGDMTDIVIKSFLWNRCYSVVAINAELDENGEPILFKNFKIDYDI